MHVHASECCRVCRSDDGGSAGAGGGSSSNIGVSTGGGGRLKSEVSTREHAGLILEFPREISAAVHLSPRTLNSEPSFSRTISLSPPWNNRLITSLRCVIPMRDLRNICQSDRSMSDPV
ncbi:uncharacterized protein LOC118645960 [Monomorium pharaonis]|uniref:uncharacterized protein LOC118645960 n=1 Tax=Monomorium pharaonis TaxID=307658 RepID=UPI0017474185|nr:uncharacterized protein LOC118645960 [Monomorium pharaonis]